MNALSGTQLWRDQASLVSTRACRPQPAPSSTIARRVACSLRTSCLPCPQPRPAPQHAQADNLTVLEYFTAHYREPGPVGDLIEVALNYARILLQVGAGSSMAVWLQAGWLRVEAWSSPSCT